MITVLPYFILSVIMSVLLWYTIDRRRKIYQTDRSLMRLFFTDIVVVWILGLILGVVMPFAFALIIAGGYVLPRMLLTQMVRKSGSDLFGKKDETKIK